MPQALNDRQYLEKQYKDSSNLDARINLHRRFSTNKYGWHPWIFDHIDLPPQCRILELGCGPGYLWLENLGRIPTGWEIILSDFSTGMLEEARRNLEKQRPFQFKIIDAQSIPCEDRYFDAVIANHMLYHVPDRPAALAEIRRVLKPAGQFYASTVGDRHLIEIGDLIGKFDPELASWGRVADSFLLENGMAQLSKWFAGIKTYRYEDALEVTQAAPLADYIFSGWAHIPLDQQDQFRKFVKQEMESRGGVFHVTKDSGLFVSGPKGE
jgi:ubiquinone/menaquinone biosynthesis C-methylase UbiE